MDAIELFVPRWIEGDLVLKVGDPRGAGSGREDLRIGRRALRFRDIEVPRDAILGFRMKRRDGDRRGVRYAVQVSIDAGVLEAAGVDVPALQGPVFGERGLHVPVVRDDTEAVHELIRVLEQWRVAPEVQERWGTEAVEPLLVPTLDDALLARSEGRRTLDGVEFPCMPPTDRVRTLGCAGLLGWPVVLLAAAMTSDRWGWIAVALAVAFALGWAVARRSVPRPTGVLVIDRHGLRLPEGTRVRFAALQRVRGAHGALRIESDTGTHRVYGMKGDTTVLAAAIDGLRQLDPEEAPEELAHLAAAVRRQRQST